MTVVISSQAHGNHPRNLSPWYSPINLVQWRRRLVSARSLGLLLVAVVLILSELHFNLMEVLLGNYLVTTNARRPKSGTIWEQGSQVDSARETLGQYSTQRQSSQLEARRATSLGQVMSNLEDDKGTMISADHFIELIIGLTPAIAHEIISPYLLLAKLSEGSWTRTYFEKQDGQVLVYLLDNQNQVLDRLSIGPELLMHIKRGEVSVAMALDRMADFADHIYSAKRFFEVLNTYSEGTRSRILSHPEDLLRISGRIQRVGISTLRQGDKVGLGFEIEALDGPKVILTQGRYDDVKRLQYALEGRTVFTWPQSEEGIP